MGSVSIQIPDESSHNIRNIIVRRAVLLLIVGIFLTPSALYYYYRGSSARDLTKDPEYVTDINMLSRRSHIGTILTPTPIEAPIPLPEVKGNIFSQLLSNFTHFFSLYFK